MLCANKESVLWHNKFGIKKVSITKRMVFKMEEIKKPNHAIACTVTQCANHAHTCNFCALDKITVGTHESNPTARQCTDCESFVLDSTKCKDGKCHG